MNANIQFREKPYFVSQLCLTAKSVPLMNTTGMNANEMFN